MDTLMLKIILGIVILVLTIVFGLLPIKVLKILRKKAAGARLEDLRWPSLTLCLLSCFTGGVFLSTCFLHLLPEASENFKALKNLYGWDLDYPIAELICCGGFFLVWALEEVVVFFFHAEHTHSHGPPCRPPPPPAVDGHIPTNGQAPCHAENGTTHNHIDVQIKEFNSNGSGTEVSFRGAARNSPPVIIEYNVDSKEKLSLGEEDVKQVKQNGEFSSKSTSESTVVGGGRGFRHSGYSVSDTDLDERNPKQALLAVHEHSSNSRSGSYLGPSTSGSVTGKGRPASPPFSDPGFNNLDLAEPERCEVPTCEGQKEDPPILMASRPHAHSHPVRSITLLMALSFHSVIEGLAYGIQSTNSAVAALFMSLVIHKCVVAFSVGLQLARTHAHQLQWVVVSIVVLAVMTPIGVGIGIAADVSDMNRKEKDIIIMVFEGLAVGTFLYVTFFEVFIHERDNEHPNLLKLVVTAVGFALIGLLRVFEHEHGDSGHEHSTSLPQTTPIGRI